MCLPVLASTPDSGATCPTSTSAPARPDTSHHKLTVNTRRNDQREDFMNNSAVSAGDAAMRRHARLSTLPCVS
jgi:hypothetical protein